MATADFACAAFDDCYQEFVTRLSQPLQSRARALPGTIEEPVTLALPSLVLAGLGRRVRPELAASAQRAHLFAMLGAVVRERILGGEFDIDAQLDELLAAFDHERRRGLAELRLLGADRNTSFAEAERDLVRALVAECAVFDGDHEVDLFEFVVICSGKHSLAFTATMAAAAVAGAELDELAHVHDLILATMVGVSYRKELLAHLAGLRTGRSWFASFARTRDPEAVAVELLDLAVDAFERLALAASALGVADLASWAIAQGRELCAIVSRDDYRSEASAA